MTASDRAEYCRQKSRDWRQANRDRHRAYSRKWRADNPERKAAANLKWAEHNPDKMAEYRREWVLRNPEQARNNWRDWRRANPATVNASTRRRRARLANAVGNYTSQEWEALCAAFDNRCLCCGEKKPLSADHVIPISVGGINRIQNIQPLCRECNSSKGTKTIDYRVEGGLPCSTS